MMKVSFVWVATISLLASLTATVEAADLLFVKKSKATKLQSKSAILVTNNIPRGGGGAALIDPELAAKLFVGVYGLNAAGCTLAPAAASEQYGLKSEPANHWLMRFSGAIGLNVSVLLYLQKFQGMAFEKAIGWSVWPFVLNCAYGALDKSDSAVDIPATNHIPSGALNLLVFYASITNASWAPTLNQVYGLWSLVWVIPILVFPESAAKVWSISLKNDSNSYIYSMTGSFLLSHGLAICMQTRGSGGLMKAIGGTAAGTAVSLAYLAVMGKFQKGGIKVAPAYTWMVFVALIAASLL